MCANTKNDGWPWKPWLFEITRNQVFFEKRPPDDWATETVHPKPGAGMMQCALPKADCGALHGGASPCG